MLFVFDIDNTIISHSKQKSFIPEATITALKKIKESGYRIIFASGRNYKQTLPIMEKFGVKDAIVCDGACVIVNNNVVYEHFIDENAKNSIINDAFKHNLPISVHDTNDVYVIDNDKRNATIEMIETYIKSVEGESNYEYKTISLENNCVGISCFVDFDFEHFDTIDYNQYPVGCSISAKGISKASGILKYLELKSVHRDSVHVFGDNFNDISMFQEFYENSYAVGNAPEEVKKYARHQLNYIEEEGILHAVEKILGGGYATN